MRRRGFQRLRALFARIFGVRVLLTGGYGCIGCWITGLLLRKGDSVFIYDLNEDTRRMRQVLSEDLVRQARFVAGDVADLAGLQKAIADHDISHVIHLAGLQVPTCRADPMLGARVNVLGTLAVFEAVRQSKGQVQRLVYASSAAVFGPPESYGSGPLPDDVPLKPATHYGCYKLCNEGNARVYYEEHGLSSIGLRPWTVYGVGRDFGMTSEPTKAIKALALGRPFHITFGGVQDMQFAEDVAGAFIRCAEAPYQGAKAYNLRGDRVDMAAFRSRLADMEPSAAKLVTCGDRQIAVAYDLDDSGLRNDVGALPRTPLREGMRRTLDQFRQLHKDGKLDTSDLTV
jgi:nucleoside-diphosphate-sugar epimerase